MTTQGDAAADLTRIKFQMIQLWGLGSLPKDKEAQGRDLERCRHENILLCLDYLYSHKAYVSP